MKYSLLIWGLLCWTGTTALAQITFATPDTAYRQAVENGLSALKKGDCHACLDYYQRAFLLSQKSALSTLRAAACAQLCGQMVQARAYIQKATSVDWWASEDVWTNKKEYPELALLRTSSLAIEFQKDLDSQKIAAGRNPTLERELQVIFDSDQKPRLRLDTLGKQYGFKSPQAEPVYTEMRRADSVNTSKIEPILAIYGYPGKKLVGDQLSITAWLVIQHASLALQEKYLPLMQAAAAQGDLHKSNLALLIDRIRIGNGQKQLYGSQVHIGTDGKPHGFEPIDDEPNVNKRRAEADMSPLEEYARHWGFDYVLPKR